MEFLAAKCPNCSGELRLPDDKKQVKCMYCGVDVIVRQAVNAVGIDAENWLKLASAADKNENYEEAYKYFTKVLEFEPDNYLAQLGKGASAAKLSDEYDFRDKELLFSVEEAIKNAPNNKRAEITELAAETIRESCFYYRSRHNYISDFNELISCLEVASNYSPQNELILTDLIDRFDEVINDLTGGIKSKDDLENGLDYYISKKDEYISKLQIIAPEKAANIITKENKIKLEKKLEIETERQKAEEEPQLEIKQSKVANRNMLIVVLIILGVIVGCCTFINKNADSEEEMWQKTKDYERKRDTGF
jgi:tetratricopeptide (TPR) repeat protein